MNDGIGRLSFIEHPSNPEWVYFVKIIHLSTTGSDIWPGY